MRKILVLGVMLLLFVSCTGNPAPTATPPDLVSVSAPDQAENALFVTIDMFRTLATSIKAHQPEKAGQVTDIETQFKKAAAAAYAGIELWHARGSSSNYLSAVPQVIQLYNQLGGLH